jgi:hypothetical protein
MSLVCTSSGIKFVSKTDAADSKAARMGMTHLLDCSLCVATGLPPPPIIPVMAEAPHELSYALRSIPAARLASIVSAPLPARGPPLQA